MSTQPVPVIIQARMSSTRFPGKVLAPLGGYPLIAHVITQVGAAVARDQIIVATSTAPSDDPLAAYVRELGVGVVRGPLDDVFGRFRACLDSVSCSWFFRVCADSPLLQPSLFGTMLQYATRDDVDLISNVFPRTFPKGQSLEMVKTRTFQDIDAATLTPEQRQHVTRVFYDHSSDYRIVNVTSDDPALGQTSVAVDTLDDLYALERRWFVQGAHAG